MHGCEVPITDSKESRKSVRTELVWLGERHELDKNAGKLNDPVVRAPRMPVARADGKPEPFIQFSRAVEIAHGVNDMIETAAHGFHLQHADIGTASMKQ